MPTLLHPSTQELVLAAKMLASRMKIILEHMASQQEIKSVIARAIITHPYYVHGVGACYVEGICVHLIGLAMASD